MLKNYSGGGMLGDGREGGMGGGRRGGMMGKGGGMGRGNQSAMKNMLEPIKFWIRLTLSTANNPIVNSDAK